MDPTIPFLSTSPTRQNSLTMSTKSAEQRNTPIKLLEGIQSDDFKPTERYGHSAVVYKESIWVWGGSDDAGHFLSHFERFDIKQQMWIRVHESGPSPKARHFHSAVVWKGCMWVFAGKSNGYLNDLHCFNFESKRWTEIEPVAGSMLPTKRYGHSAIVYNNAIYIFGGYDDFGLACNDLITYDFESNRWDKVKTQGITPIDRFHQSAVVYQGSMYVFGGYEALNDVQEYRFGTSTWSKLNCSGQIPEGRWGHKACVYKGVMYVFGGCDAVINYSDLYKFHFDTSRWEKANSEGFSQRYFHSAVLERDYIYLFGGKNIHNYCFNELYVYRFGRVTIPRPDTMISDFRSLLDSKEYSDISFYFPSENFELCAHMNVLSVRWPTFKEFVFSYQNMPPVSSSSTTTSTSQTTTESPHSPNDSSETLPLSPINQIQMFSRTVTVHDFSSRVFYTFLVYLYTGQIEENVKGKQSGVEDFLELMKLAHIYSLSSGFHKLCHSAIEERLEHKNVMNVLRTSYIYYDCSAELSAPLVKLCVDFLVKHNKLHEILENKLPPELLQTIKIYISAFNNS